MFLTYFLNIKILHIFINYYVICSLLTLHFKSSLVVKPRADLEVDARVKTRICEGWNFNSGNYIFTTDTK